MSLRSSMMLEQAPEEEQEFCSGALLSPHDENDLTFEDLAGIGVGSEYSAENLPESFDCNPKTAVRDQGRRDTCAAFTGATLLEYKTEQHMSPEYIYSLRMNKPSPGMYGRDVMNILTKHGSFPESSCPYNEVIPSVIPPALNFKAKGYAKIKTIEGLKHSLVHNGPCYVALPYRSPGPKFWLHPDSPRRSRMAYHAVTIVGYDSQGFKIRNSWGGDWAEAGFTSLPLSEFDHIAECWAVSW